MHFVETEQDFNRVMGEKKTTPIAMRIINDQYLLVETETKSEFIQPNKFHNPVISAFVTAYGRLVLLETLEQLGDYVL